MFDKLEEWALENGGIMAVVVAIILTAVQFCVLYALHNAINGGMLIPVTWDAWGMLAILALFNLFGLVGLDRSLRNHHQRELQGNLTKQTNLVEHERKLKEALEHFRTTYTIVVNVQTDGSATTPDPLVALFRAHTEAMKKWNAENERWSKA